MGAGIFGLSVAVLAGLIGPPETTWDLFEEEVGRTIADATLVAGLPHSVADMPDGRRAFRWERWSLNPRGGIRCDYTLVAERKGRSESLAAWRIVEIQPPAPGCGPVPPKTLL